MEPKKPGRPKVRKLISIDTALARVKEHYVKKGVIEERDLERFIPARQTIYNKINKDVLHNYGDRRCVLLDEDEVFEKLCS